MRLSRERRDGFGPPREIPPCQAEANCAQREGQQAAWVDKRRQSLNFAQRYGQPCLEPTAEPPERVVRDHVITSLRDPKIAVHLPSSTKYVGADRWVLFGIADCELHVFVEADQRKNVQRLYWIQFEQYLPSKPDLHHRYNSPRHAAIGGMEFYVDTWVKQTNDRITPGSDEEHIHTLIDAKGYKLPAGMMSVRLVHLLDDAKRKELMIIYAEDVAGTGMTAGELREGGTEHLRWPKVEQELIERAKQAVSLTPLTSDVSAVQSPNP